MAVACHSCSMTFNSSAALNFHTKKDHSDELIPTKEPEVATRPKRKRRGRSMVKFGKHPEVPNQTTTGPFELFSVPLTIATASDNEKEVEIKLKSHYVEPSAQKEARKVEAPICTKISLITSNDDDSSSQTSSSSTSTLYSPCMPKLFSHVSPDQSDSRRGPKRSRKGKHWKYSQGQDEDEIKVNTKNGKITIAKRPRKVSRDDDTVSSTSTESSADSVANENCTNTDQLSLPPQEEKQADRLRRKSADESSHCSSRSNISGEDNSATASFISGRRRPFFGKNQSCGICHMTGFTHIVHYMNHLEMHEGKRPFPCPTCSWGYETPIKLMEHISIRHSHEAMFKCTTCGTEYKTGKGLQNHKCKQPS